MAKTLTKHLQAIKAARKGLFIPYIMAGDHDKGLDGLFDTISFLEDQGVSAIEIGVPWSDPVADGPIIELAGQRSLAKGTTLTGIITELQKKNTRVPLVIMTYFNPIFQYGIENFIKDLKETSVKGIIIPDLPHEQEDFIKPYLENSDLALIPLVSLTTGLDRQEKLIKDAQGFIYAVAINGVTGKANSYRDDLDKHLKHLTELASIPVLTGFGVSTLADIERFNKVSDGVIVGSKIVRDLHKNQQKEIADFIRSGSYYQK
ncbi:tryptophan synthase subunit alpha [Streptococcus macacae]|uniref:Tryptophan synthase alpha chain n=1 Tax=Streptococcus macacae NCTC 11558 TaxID=764298 RepID=G5JWP3_9STRE|nr:tryptophan synthase subunit alpha [Streptococcus macacae]EHJ53005.1 tryptophan synthase, alpha subunit [Streptococcus macacae NCTC 11558]SUN79002.1 tryptophan synthase subunit alpha [Streptococcus macacae NCTC 11558]